MKNENIPADIKSKSLKEAKEEINEILAKLESENLDLNSIEVEYKRLMNLNKHIESIFKIKQKKLRILNDLNLMVKKRLKINAKKIDKFLINFLNKQKRTLLVSPMKYGVISGGKKIRSTIIFDAGKIFNLKKIN